jgi:hypothetical protein
VAKTLHGRLTGECTDGLGDGVWRVRGNGDGGNEKREYRDQEAGEPRASSLPIRGTSTKTHDAEHNVQKEDQPKEGQ